MSWLHKGYWYYGPSREEDEVARFKEMVTRGDTVLEIGAHIGYFSQLFEDLVGDAGRVVVVEPTEFSRRFLQKNCSHRTLVIPAAVSSFDGFSDFYLEDLGGFTNSLVEDFTNQSNENLSVSQVKRHKTLAKVKVETKRVDTLCSELQILPQFIKIDVEGAELEVLKGASKVLNGVRALMVEISRNHRDVYGLMSSHGFSAYDADRSSIDMSSCKGGNVFFLRTREKVA